MREDTEYAEKHRQKLEQTKIDRERREKQPPEPWNKGETQVTPLDAYFKNPNKAGWWDEDIYYNPSNSKISNV